MMSMTMIGLTLGPLVRVLLLLSLKNPLVVFTTPLIVLAIPLVVLTIKLVVFVTWVLVFLFQ